MEAINRRFTEILGGSKQFIVPVFQRDYRWTSEQCRQIWKDILRVGGDDGGHFIGSIVYVKGGSDNVAFQQWLVIDGQQRLASLTLLMTALRDHIAETQWSGTEDSPTVDKINAYFLKNMLETGDRRYKLALRRADDATLRALVDGPRPPEWDENASDLIIEAYEHFRGCLRDPDCDPDAVYRGIDRLNIVNITLEHGTDDPQLIFESLNSTGVDLSQSDLVRNYLLMGLNEAKQTRLYNEYWREIEVCFKASGDSFDSFLRDYVVHRMKSTQQPRFNRIYQEFKSFRQQKCEESLETLLLEMVPIARFYASFLGLASVSELPEELSDAMGNMRKLATTQGPLVMHLYSLYKNGSLSQEDFVHSVTLIESYILRRNVVGLSNRGYWEIFARIARDMGSDLESLRVVLARLRDNSRFPDDDEFRQALEKGNLYGLWICRHILDRIENAGQRERSPVDNYSIEHIMPQDILDVSEWQEMLGDDWEMIHRTWLHRLGNLTLTAYNSTYSNRPFHEKRDIKGGFRDSAVRLNKSVRDQDEWTETQMRERGERLVSCALDIWPYHGADQKQIQEADLQELRTRATKKTSDSLDMDDDVRRILGAILKSIHELDDVIEEVVERDSVCCYGPGLFAELLPMSYYVRVMLPLDLSEIERPEGIEVDDDSSWRSVPRRVHRNCRLLVNIYEESQVTAAMPIIRQAFDRQVL